MMKRILHKIKLVLIGAIIAALDRVILELDEYLEQEQGQERPAGGEGGNAHVCG